MFPYESLCPMASWWLSRIFWNLRVFCSLPLLMMECCNDRSYLSLCIPFFKPEINWNVHKVSENFVQVFRLLSRKKMRPEKPGISHLTLKRSTSLRVKAQREKRYQKNILGTRFKDSPSGVSYFSCKTCYKRWLSVCRPFLHWTLSFFSLYRLHNKKEDYLIEINYSHSLETLKGDHDEHSKIRKSSTHFFFFPFYPLFAQAKENYLSVGSLIKFHSRGLRNAPHKTDLTKRCGALLFPPLFLLHLYFSSLTYTLCHFVNSEMEKRKETVLLLIKIL